MAAIVQGFLVAVTCAQSLFHEVTEGHRARTYDVLHYKLVVSFDERLKEVIGTTSIRCTPLEANLDSLVFDAAAMNVTSVSLSSGHELRFDNKSPELTVHLDRPCSPGDTLNVVIAYSCCPKKGLYFIQPDSGNPRRRHQIWTQGEDTDNRYWFPCYDYPDDKATSEVVATVPEHYTLLSNGNLVSERHDAKSETRTFHWRQAKPHASYLIMLAAGEYSILDDSCNGIPLQYYVYKEDVNNVQRSFGCTPKAMKFFEDNIGYPFPWEKYAQIVIEDFMWGGMENTSAVTINEASVIDARAALDFSSDDVISHELAHQWWGDLVTCRDWSQLWLNEGFATYFEELFNEHEHGRDEFAYALFRSAESIRLLDQSLGRKPIVSNDNYATNLYNKGAWVLHMLRNILGEQNFRKVLQLYLRQHAFGNVDTRDLERAVEDVTGQRLDWFFDQWVFRAGYPRLSVRTSWDEHQKDLSIEIEQSQPVDSLTGIFRLPLAIECTTSQGKTSTEVWLTEQHQVVNVPLGEKPLMVSVDGAQNVLKSLEFDKTKDEFMYQARHADDVADRIVAIRELREYPEDSAVAAALEDCALHDTFWGVRKEAARSLDGFAATDVKETLYAVAQDANSKVRNEAIRGLGYFRTPDVASFLMKVADRDSSYVVLGSCLETLAIVDSLKGYDLARRYIEEDSYRDIVRRAALNVLGRMHDRRALPYAVKYSAPGNRESVRTMAIGILGTIGDSDTTARAYVMQLAGDGMPGVRRAAVRILGGWGGAATEDFLERRKHVEQDEGVLKAIDSALRRMDD